MWTPQNEAPFRKNKNARHPKETLIARNLKEIKILDRAGEDQG